ncbi:DUF4148 domain-containing protein [Caballeronia sp. LZ062]|uniref:DUF4148 domain-containing protein n=2 Tax=unclassified Caballeronia TaxID=2646786 RepID=UPI002864CF27|nr:DUF4148 domain-containing protein [Caballeronia sp. LZ050]MDR5855764.1 DUF4148 domain-containing protein [Caballeronia sp. LZ050]MDR5872449.1 DUF4148 domain-containing protein [Caballeronia sp. LZ062]
MKAVRIAVIIVTAGVSAGSMSAAISAESKTREQVRQELLMAQHDGVTAVNKPQYPPTDEMLTRNRELHTLTRHAGEESPAFEQHDAVAGR